MTIKDLKNNYIIENSCELFLNKSVSDVTIKDIAVKCGVGEATIYRYFTKKYNIVSASALMLQKKVFEEYFKLQGKNGYEKLADFYNGYLKIFENHLEFFKFINEFDAYVLNENVTVADEYSEGLDLFKDAFLSAYNQGVKDKSVKKINDIESFYYSTTHALLALCKKLAVNKSIVKQDDTVKKEEEIKTLIGVILYSVKKS